MQPLVSVVVLSYWNYKYLHDAVSSVFFQDYDNIELVISNDSSEDFDEEQLIHFINQHRPDNIKKVIINNNERNLGTVRNFNKAIKMSSGEFIAFLAGDDMLYDHTVISTYVNHLNNLGEDALIANSGVTLFDSSMENAENTYPLPKDKKILAQSNPKELFKLLALKGCFFPTTCCVKRLLFEKIGYVNEEIRLIEDWALYLMVSRNGFPVHYMDKVTLKHRAGGLCHGGDNYQEDLSKRFRKDEIKTMELEILPYKTEFGNNEFRKIRSKYNFLKASYAIRYDEEDGIRGARLKRIIKASPWLFLKAIKLIYNTCKDACLNKFGQPYFVLITLSLALIYSLVDFTLIIGGVVWHYFQTVVGLLALLFSSLFTLGILARLFRYILWPFKKLRSMRNK